MRKKLVTALAALALVFTGLVVQAPAANAYSWTQKYQASDGTYWAYKVCTREEWFNGCTPGWYRSSWPWWMWG